MDSEDVYKRQGCREKINWTNAWGKNIQSILNIKKMLIFTTMLTELMLCWTN